MEKMKKNKLAVALATCLGLGAFSGGSQAVNVAPDHIGDFFYVPYFSTVGGQETQVKVVNTSRFTVMAKIILRRSTDSLEIVDFDIVLSPYDEWVGKIIPEGKTLAVWTDDETCTVPHKWGRLWHDSNNGRALSNEFTGSTSIGAFGDSVTQTSSNVLPGFRGRSISPIREGYAIVEVMGVSDISTDAAGSVPWVAKHDAHAQPLPNGKTWYPRDCNAIDFSFANRPLAEIKGQFTEPENVLKVTSTLVNAAQGKAVAVPTTALANAFRPSGDQRVYGTNMIRVPSIERPDERDVVPAISAVLRDAVPEIMGPETIPTLFVTDFTNQAVAPVKALSSTLLANSLIGTYDTTNGASTNWIVTFPTKKWHLDAYPNIEPFTDSVVYYGMRVTDQEERNLVDFSRPSNYVNIPYIPYEVNVLGPSAVNSLSSGVFTNLAGDNDVTFYDKGWLKLDFVSSPITGNVAGGTSGKATITHNGLPAIGFQYDENLGIAATAATTQSLGKFKSISAQ